MLRWVSAAVTALVLSAFTVLLVTGHYAEEGPTLASVSDSHGVHRGDLYVLAGWAVGMAGLLACARGRITTRKRDDGRPNG